MFHEGFSVRGGGGGGGGERMKREMFIHWGKVHNYISL